MLGRQHKLQLIVEAQDRASRTLRDVESSVRSLGGGIKILSGLAGGAMGFMAVRHIASAAWEWAQYGAQVERVSDAYRQMAGANPAASLETLRKAARGTIDDMSLMLAANRASMLQVSDDAETIAKLLQVAAQRGRALGISTQQAFNDMITGIGRLSPLILDNLGIVLDAKNTYEEYAGTLGKAADELTEIEKRQALVNRVTAEATGELGTLDAAGGIEAQAAAWANLKGEAGKFIAEMASGTGIIGDLTIALQDATTELAAYRSDLEQVRGPANEFNAAIEQAVRDEKIGANVAEAYRGKLGLLMAQYDDGTITLQEYQAALKTLHHEMIRIYRLRDEPSPNPVDFWPAIEKANDALGQQIKLLNEAHDAAWIYANALGVVSDEMFVMEAGGGMPKRKVRPPMVSASERYDFAQTAMGDTSGAANQLAAEQRSLVESLLTATQVTDIDMARTRLGDYTDQWDEYIRRIRSAATDADSQWKHLIPEDVLARGADAIKVWVAETEKAFYAGQVPGQIDWEAFDRAAQAEIARRQSREALVQTAMGRLGGMDLSQAQVAELLGLPPDMEQQGADMATAMQTGFSQVDAAATYTETFALKLTQQADEWTAMGRRSVGWMVEGMTDEAGGDVGRRLAKALWPWMQGQLDAYYNQGVPN